MPLFGESARVGSPPCRCGPAPRRGLPGTNERCGALQRAAPRCTAAQRHKRAAPRRNSVATAVLQLGMHDGDEIVAMRDAAEPDAAAYAQARAAAHGAAQRGGGSAAVHGGASRGRRRCSR